MASDTTISHNHLSPLPIRLVETICLEIFHSLLLGKTVSNIHPLCPHSSITLPCGSLYTLYKLYTLSPLYTLYTLYTIYNIYHHHFTLACGPLDKPACIKTHLRNMIIVPEMIGSMVAVYNGKVETIPIRLETILLGISFILSYLE